MTDEEKHKLYEAIGYQETPTITEYPKEVNLNTFTGHKNNEISLRLLCNA